MLAFYVCVYIRGQDCLLFSFQSLGHILFARQNFSSPTHKKTKKKAGSKSLSFALGCILFSIEKIHLKFESQSSTQLLMHLFKLKVEIINNVNIKFGKSGPFQLSLLLVNLDHVKAFMAFKKLFNYIKKQSFFVSLTTKLRIEMISDNVLNFSTNNVIRNFIIYRNIYLIFMYSS